MMPGYGYGMGAWGWVMMGFWTLLFIALIAAVVWLLARNTAPSGRPTTTTSHDAARDILAQRYARGEIDETEYQKRLQTIASR